MENQIAALERKLHEANAEIERLCEREAKAHCIRCGCTLFSTAQQVPELKWKYIGKHHIYGTDGNQVAAIPVLEHSVGQARFEVYSTGYSWSALFWHGNQGHDIGSHGTQKDAMAAAQNHFNKLVTAMLSAAPAEGSDDGSR